MMVLGSLRGLRVQLLLWTVLPLTLIFVGVTVLGINTHQRAMRSLVEELDARSAKLAAEHLGDGLTQRVSLLTVLATQPHLSTADTLPNTFDGGIARFTPDGTLSEADPAIADWSLRPTDTLFSVPTILIPETETLAHFSPIFFDPTLQQESILIAVDLPSGGKLAGAVSLKQLGLADIIAQASQSPAGQPQSAHNTVAFLVNVDGRVIYHSAPNPEINVHNHVGALAAIGGQSGATYYREPGGREWVVGYAPVPGPGWGLVVQEPWESLIVPVMRLSLLTPLLVVVAALISGLAVTFGLRYVIRPLQTLDRQASRVAWGDFSSLAQPVGGIREIEDLRLTLQNMAAQIQRYQTGMRDYIAAVTMAQEEERKRLARELHDETVQALIALGHRVEMAQRALDKDPAHARQRLAELRQLAGDIQAEVRRFSRALRPLYLEDLGFVPALEMLAQEIERDHSLTVEVRVAGNVRRLPPDLEMAAYRITQESLSNVVRHAEATHIWLTVTFAANSLILHTRDDGVGFTSPVTPADLANKGHYGLMGIHERALLFGGTLTIQSTPGTGTVLEVSFPVPKTSLSSHQ